MQIIPKVRLSSSKTMRGAWNASEWASGLPVLLPDNAKRYRRNYMPYSAAIYRARSLVIFIPNETRMKRERAACCRVYVYSWPCFVNSRGIDVSPRGVISPRAIPAISLVRGYFNAYSSGSGLPFSFYLFCYSHLSAHSENHLTPGFYFDAEAEVCFSWTIVSRARFFFFLTHPMLDFFQRSGSPKSSLHTAKILPPTVSTTWW